MLASFLRRSLAAAACAALLVPAACAPRAPQEVAAAAGEATRIAVVDRSESRLYYFEKGECAWAAPVVVGAVSSPTPVGRWRVAAKKVLEAGTAYGIRKLPLDRLSKDGEWEGGAYAIHGTDREALLEEPAPRSYSNGCVRLRNDDVVWLYGRLAVGDPVVVIP